ncbi:MAG: succinate dehydrogenase [Terriglobia bacterium]
MAAPDVIWQNGRFGKTTRRDNWWVLPLLVFLGFGVFLIYANWAAFQGNNYTSGPYISPFYSPELWGDSPHALFGPKPSWFPAFIPYSPALLILWIPGLFRFTCYYYRGAYYKAFWADPPACSVGEPRKSYWGERTFPLILQNSHRYFLRLSILVWAFLVYDAVMGFDFDGHFGIGLGSIVLTINVVLLAGYLFGCHALRHTVGGRLDQISNHPVRHKLYDCVSCLNGSHKLWAWASLFSVGFSDIYVRLCAMGIWHDWRIL